MSSRCDGLIVNWLRAFTAKPYPPREAWGVVWRNLAGASFANPAGLQFAPRTSPLNDITPVMTLGFGGDVMSMFGRQLHVNDSVRLFFQDCDHVVLNFEGVISDQPQISPDQKHTRPILDALCQLAPRERLLLSMANNHTGDFGEAECRRCLDLLSAEGFRHFGVLESPFFDLTPSVRVVTGTRWSNRTGQHLSWLNDPTVHAKPDALNVLYPHWGYELEVYPRQQQVDQMQAWLRPFDAVVGHHSHTPQPITTLQGTDGVGKLAAYSLGDLCFGMAYKRLPTFKNYVWGTALKVTAGPLKSNPQRWALGEMSWTFVECIYRSRAEGFELRTVPDCDLFQASAFESA